MCQVSHKRPVSSGLAWTSFTSRVARKRHTLSSLEKAPLGACSVSHDTGRCSEYFTQLESEPTSSDTAGAFWTHSRAFVSMATQRSAITDWTLQPSGRHGLTLHTNLPPAFHASTSREASNGITALHTLCSRPITTGQTLKDEIRDGGGGGAG